MFVGLRGYGVFVISQILVVSVFPVGLFCDFPSCGTDPTSHSQLDFHLRVRVIITS
jgi:hypothetical protein